MPIYIQQYCSELFMKIITHDVYNINHMIYAIELDFRIKDSKPNKYNFY